MKQKIFDAHFHLWDLEQVHLEWLENLPHLKRNFALSDLKRAYQGFEFLGGLYMEADTQDKASEAKFAFGLNEKGILFALASLEEGICAFREVLHTSKKGAKRLLEEDFQKILATLERRGLVFEACIKSEELEILADPLRTYPSLRICLNHFGNPKECDFEGYKKALQTLSAFPQLFIKLSAPDDLSLDSKEWIDEVLGLVKFYFPSDRLLFGSNFPVAKLSPSEWIGIISQNFGDLEGIFHLNALNLYERR